MSPRRIVVRVEAAPQAKAVIQTAVQVAARLEAELVGLFIEDETLLQWAALPFACEIGIASATSRPRDVTSMERLLRALAGEAHRALADIAGRASLQWRFRVSRGALLRELGAAAEEADVLVSRSHGLQDVALVAASDTPVLVLEEGQPQRLLAVCTPGTNPHKAAELLAALAACGYEKLEVLLAGDNAGGRQWEQGVRAGLRRAGMKQEIRFRPSAEPARLRVQALKPSM